jgi:glycine hydroxymethyltransferase
MFFATSRSGLPAAAFAPAVARRAATRARRAHAGGVLSRMVRANVPGVSSADNPESRSLREQDPELADWLQREDRRQATTLTLIASENHCSAAVREACRSRITDKYAEGYPSRRYYGGCEIADAIEELARARAMQLFAAEDANVQPHSGTTANLAALVALAGSGGRILGMSLKAGGHLSHGHDKSHSGQLFEVTQYGVRPTDGRVDLDEVRKLAREHRPNVIIVGGSSYPRALDYPAFAAIAKEVGARLLADIAHPAGLIAAGVMASPVGIADVVTMTTHKTLRGPRGGMILFRSDVRKQIQSAVFPGAQGGPLMHQIAAKAVAFGEALAPGFRSYQRRVQDNASLLASHLLEHGLDIVTGGTDNHIVLVDLRKAGITGAAVEERALVAGLCVNKNAVPDDPLPPMVTSGLRLGTAAITSRGMGPDQVRQLGDVIVAIVRGDDAARHHRAVADLCAAFPLP